MCTGLIWLMIKAGNLLNDRVTISFSTKTIIHGMINYKQDVDLCLHLHINTSAAKGVLCAVGFFNILMTSQYPGSLISGTANDVSG
jgi:hypothetical protein